MRLIMVGVVGLAMGLVACERRVESPASVVPPATDTSAAGPTSYTVRGEIVSLPDGSPTSEFRVHHEAIPGFKDRNDMVVGMNEMTMPFPLGEGVVLDGLKVGDAIELDFTVDWNSTGGKPYFVTAVRPLPEGETLEVSHEGHDHGHEGHAH